MKKLIFTLTLVVTTSLSISPIWADKKLLLKTPSAYNSTLPGLGTSVIRLAKQLKLMSGGTLRMKFYEPGKLVEPFEILDTVSTGKVNSGYATAGYWAGKMPAASLFSSVPFGPETGEYLAWMYYGNGLKLYQEMYDKYNFNVKVIPCAIIAPETSGWFKKEINTPADLKGLKMRFFGLGGRVMQKLGVATSLTPGKDIFPSLEKGAIEATEYSNPAIDKQLGLHKLAKYNYFPGWHQQSSIIEFLVNKKVWNDMSDQHKAILENACKASMTNSFAESEAIQHKVMKENTEKNGVIIKRWSPEMLAAFKKAWQEVIKEEDDEFFHKVYNDMQTFRDGYKLWKNNAFLPR